MKTVFLLGSFNQGSQITVDVVQHMVIVHKLFNSKKGLLDVF